MKLLLVLLAVLFGVWLWRSRQADAVAQKRPKPSPPPALQNMVSCALCGVHLPQTEAVPSEQRWYCCKEHRQRAKV